MGSVNTKIAYTAGFSALAGMIIFVFFGPGGGSEERKSRELQVKGLRNLGSTCYVSAVLQSLAACDHFKSFVATCFQRYNPVDSNGRCIMNSKSQLFPLVAALHRACLFVNRQSRISEASAPTSSSDPAPQVNILRVLSNLNYKLPRGSEQDSFELFEYVMSGIQEEMVTMAQQSKGNDYACILPNVEPEDAQLVEVVVETMGRSNSTKVEMTTAEVNDNSSSVQQNAIVDGSGDRECVQVSQSPDQNFINCGGEVSLENFQVPHISHRLGYYHSSKRTILFNPFVGSVASRLQCLTCLSQNPWKIEAFNGFSLPLPQKILNVPLTLRDLIDNYLKLIIVHEVECESCFKKRGFKTKSSFSKITAVARLPKSLCFQIQRSSWGFGGNHKRSDFVKFNEILDLSFLPRFQDVWKTEMSLNSAAPQASTTTNETSTKDSSVCRVSRSQYRLCAVISHWGATDSGHFVTFRRGPTDKDNWFLTSDDDVLEVPASKVFNSKAYMLFYELIVPIFQC